MKPALRRRFRRTPRHRPAVVTGNFSLHYEDVVKHNRYLVVTVVTAALLALTVFVPFAAYRSYAGNDRITVEAESGSAHNPLLIRQVTDSTVSGNSYIEFVDPGCQGTVPAC